MIGSGQVSPVQYCFFEGHNKETLPISDGCGGPGVLRQDTLLSKCFSSPRCTNGYQQMC